LFGPVESRAHRTDRHRAEQRAMLIDTLDDVADAIPEQQAAVPVFCDAAPVAAEIRGRGKPLP
jgi:hypothetical protein